MDLTSRERYRRSRKVLGAPLSNDPFLNSCYWSRERNLLLSLVGDRELSGHEIALPLHQHRDELAAAVDEDELHVDAQAPGELFRQGLVQGCGHPLPRKKLLFAACAHQHITLWLSPAALAAWDPDGAGPRGAQRTYSDLAIESALTLRLLVHLPRRQTASCLTALCVLRGLDLRSPDHTTLSRRGQHFDRRRRGVPRRAGLHLLIDSTGLSIAGAGEWATAQHGGRGTRGWKTLPVGVDHTGVIVAHARTDATGDDATTGGERIEAVNDDIASVTADAAYDPVGFYDAAGARGAPGVVPPTKTARVSRRRPRSSARDHTINTVQSLGRRRWKQTSRDQQHARVENACFRYTSIIGDGLRARTPGGRTVDAQLVCNMLNAMTDMGRPASYAVGR